MKKEIVILVLLVYLSLAYTGSGAFELDCMGCHISEQNLGLYPAINPSLFGNHTNVNETDGLGNLTSWDCMACHYSASKFDLPHTSPVSTYTCEDCHINGTAPRVSNHNRTGNVSVTASCADCHSKTSNLFRYSANASAAHYGRNASFGISPGASYCAYCHSNSSSIYRDVMQNQNNAMLGNHTSGRTLLHLAGIPDCTSCHWTDRIHGTNLTRPVPNSSFCKDCHKKDILLKKDMHAGKVECIMCHADNASDIHNIKYLLQDGTYRSENAIGCECHPTIFPNVTFKLPFSASVANCTTCHLGNGLIKFADAPRFVSPLNHSSNPVSGGLWNGTQAAYWDSQVSACYYCHGQKLHDTNPLGNVSNIKAGNSLNQSITNTSFWCANCHYQSDNVPPNYFYNATSYAPLPPEIRNNSGLVPAQASDGTTFYNHSLSEYSDETCKICHAVNSPATSALFIHNVGTGGGGPNCISCHDSRGGGAPADKRIDIVSFNMSVHYGLNNGGNGACWACHGDGTRPSGHPASYKSPKKCSNDECHSLDQKFRAPMIYSHFRNASLNDNPTNAFNSNVTTSNDCQDCHVNSVNSQGKNINSTVSHFASSDLFDSINCIYCHLNEDNSKTWGNATLIYKNRTALIELNRENNKFSAMEGASVDLGFGFSLKVLEVSSVRSSVLIELIKENIIVDKSLIGIGNYTYEEYLIIDNGSVKVPVIVINITGIFKGNDTGFIQFEGFRLKRVHPEKKVTSCYSCHVKAMPKAIYKVIERASGEKDEIYYTKETVNFTDNKIFDENVVLQLLGLLTDKDLHVPIQPEKRRSLYEGESWNISEGTSLLVKGVDTKDEVVFLQLHSGDYFYEDIVKRGDIFEFTPEINYIGNRPKNITIFRAKVSGIIQAKPKNMVIIEDVVALSPEIKKILANQTLFGYNTSWLWENSTINVGKIPDNFHSPQVFDGGNGGGNCLSCHGAEGFSQKKVFSLGKHDSLNGGGNNACRACHGGTKDIQAHPAGYRTPRNCLSCHAATNDNYGAVYIGDEEHKNEKCEACHVSNIHEITALHMTPSVKKISISKENNTNVLRASVSAGYKMRVRDARYYIDTPLNKSGMFPVDGVFDSQAEDVFAQIDISGLSQGKHVVFVEAMERNNNWGLPSSLEFTIEGLDLKSGEKKKTSMLTLADTLAILLIAFVLRRFR
jgi:signal peptidase I